MRYDLDKEPQRYALLAGAIGPTVWGGDWVKYEDYVALISEVRRLREENASLLKAGEEILDWTEVKHRPPIPEAIPCGEMAGVRVHALVGLRQAIDAARKEKP